MLVGSVEGMDGGQDMLIRVDMLMIDTDTDMIQIRCDLIYPPDLLRRKLRHNR